MDFHREVREKAGKAVGELSGPELNSAVQAAVEERIRTQTVNYRVIETADESGCPAYYAEALLSMDSGRGVEPVALRVRLFGAEALGEEAERVLGGILGANGIGETLCHEPEAGKSF